METKEIKIHIPEGYEIDKESSTFECIKFKKIETPLQTITLLFGSNIYTFTKIDNFYICQNQVTQQLWRCVMKNNPSHFNGGIFNPVENVSYNDCIEFIQKLREITGLNFDLPTGEQWTKAAGNVDSQNIDDIAWYTKNNNETHSVGQKKPNNYGLYDMLGNVWEWTHETSGSYRVGRGGSWGDNAEGCRVAYLNYHNPSYRSNYIGFRLVINM